MSRFSLKIYAVLLIMGAVPLAASGVLVAEILTFNKNMHTVALETLEDVSLFHRSWARAQAEQIKLIGEKLAAEPVFRAIPMDDSARRSAVRVGQQALRRFEVVMSLRVVEGDVEIFALERDPRPLAAEMKFRDRTWPVSGESNRTITVEFGIDATLSERYEALGERRQLHRGLTQLEEEQSGSLSDVYSDFYFWMLG